MNNSIIEQKASPRPSSSPVACLAGYFKSPSSGSCIKLHQEKKTWREAEIVCQADGGNLVKIRDRVMNKLLLARHGRSTFNILKRRYWHCEVQGSQRNHPKQQAGTRRALTKLDVNKAAGPDVNKAAGPNNIKPRVLKTCSNQLASIFTFIFNLSLDTLTIPLFQTVNNHTDAEETFPTNNE
ncbi:Non-LTR (Long terminal repeat) retrotransposon and domain-containing protein [Elysia marginata]|uniref:Non-LTR (Long terminal repeat) retrotransposon and domain-containing protein n=1 Tax=Elysia marginata TaxID=1093978 RepID=A0AAV4H993_9GAST|nr:Non-LTR (Long terminal repeat) retrotransposon and domain-containing protein [Elysia marginata]